MIMMYQCMFVDYNKCLTLVPNIDSEGGCVCMEIRSYRNSLYFIFNFAKNLKLL